MRSLYVILTCITTITSIFAQEWTPESINSLRKDAEQGDADAQYNLGAMYVMGKDVPKDYAIA